MDTSIRERIVRAVMAALQAATDPAGAALHRSPTLAIPLGEGPALVVTAERDTITQCANDVAARELTLRVTALGRGRDGEDAEGIADALMTLAHRALMEDVNLGGLALGIRELECEWEREEADPVAAAVPARYAIAYRTLSADLAVPG